MASGEALLTYRKTTFRLATTQVDVLVPAVETRLLLGAEFRPVGGLYLFPHAEMNTDGVSLAPAPGSHERLGWLRNQYVFGITAGWRIDLSRFDRR